MILDLIILLLFLITAFIGYKKGAIKQIARLVSLIVAFVLAYTLASSVGDYLKDNTKFGEYINTKVNETIIMYVDSNDENYEIEDMESEHTVKEDTEETLDKTSIIVKIKDVLNIHENNEELLVEKVSKYIYTALGFVIVFIGVRIVLGILTLIIDKIFELPVLKSFNKLGGVIIAVLLLFIEISIILSVIQSMSSLEFMKGAVSTINSSMALKSMYNNNIVANIILSKIIK